MTIAAKKIKGTNGEARKPLTPGRVCYLIFAYLVLAFIVAVSVGPIAWVIMSSFKSNGAILTSPFILPDTFNFDAYVKVITQFNFGTYAVNSFTIATSSTIVAMVILSMSSYVIAKYNFPFKNHAELNYF